MIELLELEAYCNQQLAIDQFDDYCPNGLQVEAAATPIKRLLVGVTACQALIDEAVAWQADLLLVHHGFFWKGEEASIRGIKARRIGALMRNNISLIAYHLPLDAHPRWGNNRQLAERLGFSEAQATQAGQGLLWQTKLSTAMTPEQLETLLQHTLGRVALHIAAGEDRIFKIGWCTGAAQGLIQEAAELGLDAFISGEVSESTVHTARELGIHYFAAGHHATERYGVQALGQHLTEKYTLDYRFVDIHNPV